LLLRARPAAIRGAAHNVGAAIRGKEKLSPITPKNGSFGLPGDFLIASDGRVIASKYGEHAYDQWTVDEVLELANGQGPGRGASPAGTPPGGTAS